MFACKRLAPLTSCYSHFIAVNWLRASAQCHHERLQARPLIASSIRNGTRSLLSKGPKVSGITTSWIVRPDDTTFLKIIHGGITLSFIEQAGYIASIRHCSADEDRCPVTIGLARVNHVDFYEPIPIGNIADLQAAVTYTSPHSMEVTVDVWAENLKTGRKKCTNTGTLWYVALPSDVEALKRDKGLKPLLVPQLEGLSEEEREEGRRRYEAQKASRKSIEASLGLDSVHPLSQFLQNPKNIEEHTASASLTTFTKMFRPSDCLSEGYIRGGSILKLMDEAAGVCSWRHCRGVIMVTVCIDAIDFHSSVRIGERVYATARVVFTSSNTIEVEVVMEAEGLATERRVACSAFFTFASLSKEGVVPPLKLQTEEEREKFEKGRTRYNDRKKLQKRT